MPTTSSSIDVWGPKLWGALHAITFRYGQTPTRDERTHMFNLFASLPHVLPCAVCRAHFATVLAQTLPSAASRVLDDRESLSMWLVDVHNAVNARLGKAIVPYARVHAMYSDASEVCPVGAAAKAPPCSRFGGAAVYFASSVAILVACIVLTRFALRCRPVHE